MSGSDIQDPAVDDDPEFDYNGGEEEEEEEEDESEEFDDVTSTEKQSKKPAFFSDMSIQELVFGVGAIGVNGLCLGMMLNIPTLVLHNIMYKVTPKGLLDSETSDQDRIAVCKAIVDHWLERTEDLKPSERFKQLHRVFVSLRETDIAQELKVKFKANEQISLELFHKFDLGRLGPYVPPVLDILNEWGEEEGYYEDDDED